MKNEILNQGPPKKDFRT